jgi:hypothetical protein
MLSPSVKVWIIATRGTVFAKAIPEISRIEKDENGQGVTELTKAREMNRNLGCADT